MSSRIRLQNFRQFRLAQLLDMAAYKCASKAALKNIRMARQFYKRCEQFRSELTKV